MQISVKFFLYFYFNIFLNCHSAHDEQLSIIHTYSVDENVTKDHIIDHDVRKTIGLSYNSYIKLGPGPLNSFVHLDEKNGTLWISQEVDLEGTALCQAEPNCCRNKKSNERSLVEYLQPGSFCVIQSFIFGSVGVSSKSLPIGRLALVIRDVNDNKPDFFRDNEMELRKFALGKLPLQTTTQLVVKFREGAFVNTPQKALPLAKDQDFSENFRIKRYALLGQNDDERSAQPSLGPFRLVHKQEKGQLFLELMVPLDREIKSEFNFWLLAIDGGNLFGKISIKVLVEDVNEFDPVFVDSTDYGSTYKVISCDESKKVGSELYQVKAIDKDAPPGNLVKYYLMGSEIQAQFQIDPESGRISLRRPLDYEKMDEYELTILAVDSGVLDTDSMFEKPRDQRTATTTIKVVVNDVNDNKPIINLEHGEQKTTDANSGLSKLAYEFSINENIPHGSPVTYFSVIDHDSGENGQVSCQLLNWSQVFRLSKFSELYSIETISDIDRENQASYNLKISCQDNGKPSQINQANILVKILDENDVGPVFSKSVYHFKVEENTKIGTKLLSVSGLDSNTLLADDKDSNSSLVYRLEPINELINFNEQIASVPRIGHQFFDYKTPEGFFVTKSTLDREMYPLLGFRLCADDSIHVACTDVIVNITDVNDNPPRFKRDTHILQIVENQIYIEPLIKFEIEDPDLQKGEVYQFSIVPDQTGDGLSKEELDRYFTFRDEKMYLIRSVDREIIGNFHFYVSVSDSTHRLDQKTGKIFDSDEAPGTTEIFIGILDVNDNQPSFIFPNSSTIEGNSLNVSCHEIMGAAVGSIKATDLDQGINGTIIYSLSSLPPYNKNNQDVFYLDNQTGLLYCNSNRLEELCGTHYSFTVMADDIGIDEMKRGKQPTSERLIVFLQDQPTLTEVQAAEVQYSLETSYRDVVGNSLSISTKTILNIILGGSTLFFIGLLIIWILLLVYHRNKRHHLMMHNSQGGYPPFGEGQHHEALKNHHKNNFDIYPDSNLNSQSIDSNSLLGTNMTSLPIYNQLKMIDSPKVTGLYTIHHGPINDAYKTLIRSPQSRPTSVSNELNRKDFSDSSGINTSSSMFRNAQNKKSLEDILDMTKHQEHTGPYQRILLKNKTLGNEAQYCTFERDHQNSENVYKVLDNSNYLLRSPGKVLAKKSLPNNNNNNKEEEDKSMRQFTSPSNDRKIHFSSLKRNRSQTGVFGNQEAEVGSQFQSESMSANSAARRSAHEAHQTELTFLQDVLNSCV